MPSVNVLCAGRSAGNAGFPSDLRFPVFAGAPELKSLQNETTREFGGNATRRTPDQQTGDVAQVLGWGVSPVLRGMPAAPAVRSCRTRRRAGATSGARPRARSVQAAGVAECPATPGVSRGHLVSGDGAGDGALVTWGPHRDYRPGMSADRSFVRVKAMIITPNADRTAHAVSVNGPTTENPDGYHRLIGGSVEVGETHRDAITREVQEELAAGIEGLTYLAAIENIFWINGDIGHEIVFLYSGTLDPPPALAGATLTETDGSVVPIVWRPFADDDEPLPLFPAAVGPWLAHLIDRTERGGA